MDSHFPPTSKIIGSKRFLPLCCSRKCQSALAYSFIECYSSPWLLPRRPPLSSHHATSFKGGLSQRLWIMTPKTKTMWHIISILRVVWTNNKFALLITVWKAKELPSEVKCHCQSPRVVFNFKGHFTWIMSQYLWKSRWDSEPSCKIFFSNLVDRAWKPLLNVCF